MASVFLSGYKGHLFYPKMSNNVGKKWKDNKKRNYNYAAYASVLWSSLQFPFMSVSYNKADVGKTSMEFNTKVTARCLHWRAVFVVVHRGPTESFATWWSTNHPKLKISDRVRLNFTEGHNDFDRWHFTDKF